MTRQRNEEHTAKVDLWLANNSDVPPPELPQLYINAIQAIRISALSTLSGVTVAAVLDKTLHKCSQSFPVLTALSCDQYGLYTEELFGRIKRPNDREMHAALRELLIEMLDVFASITADILTNKLHKELLSVSIRTMPSNTRFENQRLLSINRKKRE